VTVPLLPNAVAVSGGSAAAAWLPFEVPDPLVSNVVNSPSSALDFTLPVYAIALYLYVVFGARPVSPADTGSGA